MSRRAVDWRQIKENGPTPVARWIAYRILDQNEQSMSVSELARRAEGLSGTYVWKLLNEGKSVPSPETIRKLAAALGDLDGGLQSAGYPGASYRPSERDADIVIQTNDGTTHLIDIKMGRVNGADGLVKQVEALTRLRGLEPLAGYLDLDVRDRERVIDYIHVLQSAVKYLPEHVTDGEQSDADDEVQRGGDRGSGSE